MRKKVIKKIIIGVLSTLVVTATLIGCGSSGNDSIQSSESESVQSPENNSTQSSETIIVDFWTAPEQYNLEFWSTYAEKFNSTNTELDGRKIEVKVQMMPAQPSSEAGIQNAIATGTVPTISENINRSFANTLAESDAIYDLSEESWFEDVVNERQITETMKGWEINGSQYVMPLYVNPITVCYNSNALRELGINEVPQTRADLDALLQAYEEKQEELKNAGITHFMYRAEFLNSANFWERWFDIEAPYNAIAQGTPLVDGNKLTADKEALQKVFEIYAAMGSSLLTGTIDGVWQQETVQVVMGCGLPWEITANNAAGKTYGLDGDYVFGPTLVENENDSHYNYADSKGIVLYNNDSVSEDEHNGAIEFMKYVFIGAGKDTFDVDWLNITSMLPVRGDLDTDENLKTYFDENPALKDISAYVADGIPGMAHEKSGDIMTALGEKAIIPLIQDISQYGIGENPDVSQYVDAAMEAMKTAGDLE